jgi:putative ABC transport system permease protein
MSNGSLTEPARLRTGDQARVASIGLRARPMRAALSALGIAIGVAAIVAVLGLSQSSQAGLRAAIDQLGTNLLTAESGQTLAGQAAQLPLEAPARVAQLPAVQQVAHTGTISAAKVYRSPLIPSVNTNALQVKAASLDLLPVVATSMAQGSWLNAATATQPVAELGAVAAHRLGIEHVSPGERIWLGGQWFYIGGILRPAVLADEINSSVLVGYPAAQRYLNYTTVAAGQPTAGPPSTMYVRTDTDQVPQVQSVLAQTADPEAPNEVNVSQPSDALTARAAARGAFNSLFLGLGAVALVVGAVGVANIMIISVLERRSEIGLRRALGATRGQIRTQFLSEAIMLAVIGGAVGVGAGALATLAYANTKGWAVVIPVQAWAGGIGSAMIIGAVAGLLPALRAARMSPTEALRTV